MKKFTPQHIADFKAYRRVQRSNRYNMLSQARQAATAAGLTREEYFFVLDNYEELAKLAGE
jgi:hypothetical protein